MGRIRCDSCRFCHRREQADATARLLVQGYQWEEWLHPGQLKLDIG